ncbi:hypothetical protein EUV02_12900 [Polymorphobacter arshaanensis]|uniref:Uncharacterized protein n=1 Tax=Glacieibacterium arshaanense TaxID=2511025 RepID=A0A4Y9EKU4_9SPHN|nr:hypothetical protein [Polymorphobacter arshaanensis]TFU01197.1 hypothetical protein EUV02_12900 [Polymorphobacter arshaanensis]
MVRPAPHKTCLFGSNKLHNVFLFSIVGLLSSCHSNQQKSPLCQTVEIRPDAAHGAPIGPTRHITFLVETILFTLAGADQGNDCRLDIGVTPSPKGHAGSSAEFVLRNGSNVLWKFEEPLDPTYVFDGDVSKAFGALLNLELIKIDANPFDGMTRDEIRTRLCRLVAGTDYDRFLHKLPNGTAIWLDEWGNLGPHIPDNRVLFERLGKGEITFSYGNLGYVYGMPTENSENMSEIDRSTVIDNVREGRHLDGLDFGTRPENEPLHPLFGLQDRAFSSNSSESSELRIDSIAIYFGTTIHDGWLDSLRDKNSPDGGAYIARLAALQNNAVLASAYTVRFSGTPDQHILQKCTESS